MAAGILLQILHLMIALAAAPLLVGSTRLFRSRLQGRRGPSPVQPYRDLLRLLRKETVLAHDASWIFRMVPYLVFAIMLVAAGMVPMFTLDLPLAAAGEVRRGGAPVRAEAHHDHVAHRADGPDAKRPAGAGIPLNSPSRRPRR